MQVLSQNIHLDTSAKWTFEIHGSRETIRHAVSTWQLIRGHLIWPLDHLVSIPCGTLTFLIWAPKFPPGNLKLAVTGPDGPPTFRTYDIPDHLCVFIVTKHMHRNLTLLYISKNTMERNHCDGICSNTSACTNTRKAVRSCCIVGIHLERTKPSWIL